MAPWIDACKRNITEIIKSVKTQFYKMDVRFSFIGYRDYLDNKNEDIHYHFKVLGFSSDMSACVSFLDKVDAAFRGDLCEDVVGGLKKGLQE